MIPMPTASRRPQTLGHLLRVRHTLLEEREHLLGEIAYVLHLTRTVKQAILDDRARAALR